MKWVIISAGLTLFILFIAFYGGYYLINPDARGEEILSRHNLPYPVVIAHRGASIKAPESTAPAYKKAAQLGVDYLEADVQRTKDGKIVVAHDLTLQRVSNVEEVFPARRDGEIKDFTYQELEKLDFGSWFNKAFPERAREEYEGLSILTLRELITIVRESESMPGLILETKSSAKHPGIEEEIVNTLRETGWLQPEKTDAPRTIFFSFSLESLRRFKAAAPEVPRLLLITDNMIGRRSWQRWLERSEPVADGLGTKGFMSWPWYIASAHERGLFVFPYTINQLWQIKILAHFQSSGYITDKPKTVLEFLDRLSELPELD